jgi:hypothetical protein
MSEVESRNKEEQRGATSNATKPCLERPVVEALSADNILLCATLFVREGLGNHSRIVA